jgi:hypothetical protein
MKLKSFGCSFIFGTDLAVDGRDSPYATPSQLTWPALLAKNLTYEYECYARPGSGNLQILENILNQTANNNPAVFVVGWTWIDRFDYYDAEYNPGRKRSPWSTIMPIDSDNLAKTYYKDLHSEYCDKFTTLSYIKLAIDTLKQKNVPFIMTYMDELIFDQQWHTTPAVLALQEYVHPYLTNFKGQTLLDWSRDGGFAISDQLHPLEAAHQAAFELIQNQSFS